MWFRRDLRLHDNPALAHAAGGPVLPVFLKPEGLAERAPGAAGLWWLDKSLKALAGDLAGRGAPLHLARGAPERVLLELARGVGAGGIAFNRLYDAPEREAEDRVTRAFREAGLEVASFKADLLVEPGGLKTKTGGVYHVFTPFWRALREAVHPDPALPAPRRLTPPPHPPRGEDLDAWGLHPTAPDWSSGFEVFTPGEKGALEDLKAFVESGLGSYDEIRNRPDLDATSRLSPRLHWGELGPAEVWRKVEEARASHEAPERDAASFLSELAWREFNHHLLAERPDLPDKNFKRSFDAFPWRTDAKGLAAWRRGRTGYPFVDAGMRQLWTTGFMHNRVRMVVASFLIKHLLVDWREGERWFWDTLLDASPANNVLNWQWVAGSGADASPFFRIFNPVAQGERFDPDGAYVRRWVPELAKIPKAFIHAPWTAPPLVLSEAGVALGRTYPKPIVDHGEARRRALDAYATLPKGA